MNQPHPLTHFLKSVREETWNRFRTQKFVYERDIRNLHKCLKTAEEIGDIGLIVEFNLTISGIEHELGNFRLAEESYTKLLALVLPLDDHWRIGAILNNLAEIYLWQRDLDKAIATYTQAVEHLQKTSQPIDTALIICNLGTAHLTQQNYTDAAYWFHQTLGIAFQDSRTHVESLMQSYTGLADLYLRLQEVEEALTHIRLAEEWAVGGDFTMDKVEIYLVYAKIAHQHPALLENRPVHYYELAKSAITGTGRKYMIAKVLLDEARYYREIYEPRTAQYRALEAQKIFLETGLTEYARLAQSVVDTLL